MNGEQLAQARQLALKIQNLGNIHRDLRNSIESKSKSLTKNLLDQLVEQHDSVIDEKIVLINKYNKLTGSKIRLLNF